MTTDREEMAQDSVRISWHQGHAHCLMCGTQNPWSFGLEFTREDGGGVRATIAALPHLQGYEGIVHGGVIAALLDAAMTHCLFHAGIRALTADLHVRYLAPVAVHSAMEIRAEVVSAHRRLHALRGEIVVDGSTVAWGEAKFRESGATRTRMAQGEC